MASLLLSPQRHRAILDSLQSSGGIRVATLAPDLGVTPETIRRDLEQLEQQGVLVRTHGGAVPIDTGRAELPLDVRETLNLDAKRAIAARAAATIEEGETIALDASSTARELARILPDIPLTVITNSLPIALTLTSRSKIRVLVTGGLLHGPSHSFVGEMAIQLLDRFHFNRAFISCQGIDLIRGLSVSVDEHAGIKRRMIDLADNAVLLADSSKFGTKAAIFFAKIDDVDSIITDTGINSAMRSKLEKSGVRVETAGRRKA